MTRAPIPTEGDAIRVAARAICEATLHNRKHPGLAKIDLDAYAAGLIHLYMGEHVPSNLPQEPHGLSAFSVLVGQAIHAGNELVIAHDRERNPES